MWFHARCRYTLPAILNRKWHPYPNKCGQKPSTWWFVGPNNDATDFKDVEVAKKVCDNLRRDVPEEDWEVVEYKFTLRMKKIY
ncbi:MAG: hypothetical protein J6Q22_09525 [Prevotella sp.]|nr:hypothetical protein [Prevotella sp.]